MFLHDQAHFAEVVRRVGDDLKRDVAMVEKDYWLTHSLASLADQGFEIWFKGGTSLSKGLQLTERFSEDLDLRLDAGRVADLREPTRSWKSESSSAIAERSQWFDDLAVRIQIPGCTLRRNPLGSDASQRSAWFEVQYPSLTGAMFSAQFRPFVLLEVGRARVVPCVPQPIRSWVADWVQFHAPSELPSVPTASAIQCIHPWVTAIEKIDAVCRRFHRNEVQAADFVRHYEDLAAIFRQTERIPKLDQSFIALAQELLEARDIRRLPDPNDSAFHPTASETWNSIRTAWAAHRHAFWGPRISLEDACATVRAFLREQGF